MIKIETHINSSIQKVWEMWTTPEHICNWNFADVDWHCPAARVDLTVGGSFTYTMAARDASFQFDFSGTYTSVVVNDRIDVSEVNLPHILLVEDFERLLADSSADSALVETIRAGYARDENAKPPHYVIQV